MLSFKAAVWSKSAPLVRSLWPADARQVNKYLTGASCLEGERGIPARRVNWMTGCRRDSLFNSCHEKSMRPHIMSTHIMK